MKTFLKIEDFPISVRAINVLSAAGFLSEQDFIGAEEKNIKELPGFGESSLAELKVFLKSRKIILVKPKREKKEKTSHPRAKELVMLLLPKGEFSFAVEIKAATKLLELYKFEDLARIKPERHITSLRYYLSGVGGWLDRKLVELAPMTLVETKEEKIEKEVEELPEVEYTPAARPMDLQSFLGLRK